MTRLLCLALIVLAGVAGRPVYARDAPGMTVLTGSVEEYLVRPGDTLASVSARFGKEQRGVAVDVTKETTLY
ncbi:MAG: hypothetical protein Q7R30_06560 [Acidobacteriota bacterium]|nr:hypothetical protein [Acidobacteriota bacterium]